FSSSKLSITPVWVALSPAGDRFAVVSHAIEGRVDLWDVQANARLASGTTIGAEPKAVDFSPDSKQLIAVGEGGIIRQWSMDKLQAVKPDKGHLGQITAIQHSPGGDGIWTASTDGTIRLWDPRDGRELR